MKMNDDEREFRLRPGKARASKSGGGGVALAAGFRMLMHYARQSSARRKETSAGGRRFPHRQRCAVRITYSKNTVRDTGVPMGVIWNAKARPAEMQHSMRARAMSRSRHGCKGGSRTKTNFSGSS